MHLPASDCKAIWKNKPNQISSIISLHEIEQTWVISGPINSAKAALQLPPHSDSKPLVKAENKNYVAARVLQSHKSLPWIYSGLCVHLSHQLSLTWSKRDDSCRVSTCWALCCISMVLSSFGDLLLNFLTSVLSGCKSQCWLRSVILQLLLL